MNELVVLDAVGSGFVTALQRAWAAGDAVLPLDPRLPGPARDAVLHTARPQVPVLPGDALVVATSGTSGEPKAVILTHAAVAASAEATSARLAVDAASDRWLACLPLSHMGGLSVVLRALHTHTPLAVHEHFDAAAVMAAADDGCTLTSLVPTALARIAPERFRSILLGGQAPPAALPPNVVVTYGLTETGSGIVYDGAPLEGVELRVGPGEEIEVRGPMLLRAYRGDDPGGDDPKGPDGWFATGDIGCLGDDGQLEVFGRRGDLVITGGENVWPVAVEQALARHPAVAAVAVVGRPHPEWGQQVVAFIVPADPARPPDLAELRAFAKASLPAYAAPTALELVSALPRTASGKVRRRELGDR